MAQPPGPPPPTPPAARPAPVSAYPTAFVGIITTDPDVMLERRIGSLGKQPVGAHFGAVKPGSPPPAYNPPSTYGPYWESDWERVCKTPCQAQVALGGEYRIAGDDVTPSDSFAITAGGMRLDVDPGNESARNAGTYMAVFGYLLAAVGGVFLGTSIGEDFDEDANDAVIVASSIGIGVGLLIGTVGVVLHVVNGTEVRDGGGRVIASPTVSASTRF